MGVHNGRSFQRLSKGAFIERHQVEYIASDWRWKHGAPLQGEDIVRSVWKHAGVQKDRLDMLYYVQILRRN
jgi:hypothetical protein